MKDAIFSLIYFKNRLEKCKKGNAIEKGDK